MPELPNIHTAIVLVLIGVALVLFATDRLRLESAALIVLVTVLLVFAVVPYPGRGDEAVDPVSFFDAFGNEALVAVCALMIIGRGVEVTGALQPMVAVLSRHWQRYRKTMQLAVLVVTAALSAFLNNTPIVVMIIPALVAIAQVNNISPSKLLLPVGLGTIIGGMATTIGTSTNLLVVTLADDIAGVRFEMFDFSWYVLVAGGAGLVYLWIIAPHILPARKAEDEAALGRVFLATLRVTPDSKLDGATVADFLEGCGHRLGIDFVDHDGRVKRAPLPTMRLHAGDLLYVRGVPDVLGASEQLLQLDLGEREGARHLNPDRVPQLAEVIVPPGSALTGKTVEAAGLAPAFGIDVVAIHRRGPVEQRSATKVKDMILTPGDILLCEAADDELAALVNSTDLIRLHGGSDLTFTHRALWAAAITVLVVVVAALGWLPISISALGGVGLMLATRCLGWRHLREALNTKVILVIVVSLVLGQALTTTGGDGYLASIFTHLARDATPYAVVASLMLFAAVLTNIVTNNAAAVIATPIAVEIATQMGIDREAIILAVLFGANLSFMTPIGYQTNLLVFSAGGYRFADFLRVGAPLLLLMWCILSGLIASHYALL